MARFLFCTTVFLALLAPTGGAQYGGMIHISYVTVEVGANGVEQLHSEGDHYIAPTGTYRHDREFADGRTTTLFRFPDEGINVSVNHDHQLAVASNYLQLPWNPSFQTRQSPAPEAEEPAPDGKWIPPVSLGARAHGPILLQGYMSEQPGVGTTETWVYEHPGVDPFVVLPVAVEKTIRMDDGQRLETRAIAIRRVADRPDTFVVPYPLAR